MRKGRKPGDRKNNPGRSFPNSTDSSRRDSQRCCGDETFKNAQPRGLKKSCEKPAKDEVKRVLWEPSKAGPGHMGGEESRLKSGGPSSILMEREKRGKNHQGCFMHWKKATFFAFKSPVKNHLLLKLLRKYRGGGLSGMTPHPLLNVASPHFKRIGDQRILLPTRHIGDKMKNPCLRGSLSSRKPRDSERKGLPLSLSWSCGSNRSIRGFLSPWSSVVTPNHYGGKKAQQSVGRKSAVYSS